MSHLLGRVVADGRTFNRTNGLNLIPSAGPLGGPRFIFLHFDTVNLSAGARLEVGLGYDTDVFNAASGSDFWSRPISGSINPVSMRIVGGTGSARLAEYGIGEPSITAGNTPGTNYGSQSNPDPFLVTNPYQEPIYETRLECHPGFAWLNARCHLPAIADAVREKVRAATGMIVEAHDFDASGHGGHVSSCSGTLIGGDLFLTARHCLTDPQGRDVRSASVTFDYDTECDGSRPAGHVTRFFKVVEEVASGASATGAADWVVVRLDAAPGQLPTPLQMRNAAPMSGETVFTMHHPGGAAKKTQQGSHDGSGTVTGFDYAGGSSGSALFDVNGDLVAGPLSQGPLTSTACVVSYASLANVKNGVNNPPAPPKPLDVLIVFDRSGSMAGAAPPIGRSKLVEAQDASALFVQLVREGAGDRLGLITFSSAATLDRPMGPAATVKPLLVGPAPFTTGQVAAITPGGTTSIGAGLGLAQLAFGSVNDRAILLMTDGLQNTAPMIEDIEPYLGATKLNVIGFGSDADINGPLLNRVAHEHGGHFTRALDGLGLRKFFGLSFGNMFESGALADPDSVLSKAQSASAPHEFNVCGEEQITVVLGWDDPATPLRAHVRAPSGTEVTAGRRIREVRGRSWLFWKIPLPYQGERDGTWQLIVDRVVSPVPRSARGREATHSTGAPQSFGTDVRYFFLVNAVGGPRLDFLGAPRHVYTGDVLNPRVSLHYPNGTVPVAADVRLIAGAPTIPLGRLAAEAGLRAPIASGDAVDGFHATLQAVAKGNGGTLPVGTTTAMLPMFDDGAHNDGAMEPDGIFNNPLKDFTRVEGTYTFRAIATYGQGCVATREVQWALHVEPGIDPTHTDVTLVNVRDTPGGRRGTIVLVPHDHYDNPLGPGRSGAFTVGPFAGVSVTGLVRDRGNGSYTVDVAWDPAVIAVPGLVVQQPDRTPVPVTPGKAVPGCAPECNAAASKLLDCLGLHDSSTKRVRVTRVLLEVDLEDNGCDARRDGAGGAKNDTAAGGADCGC